MAGIRAIDSSKAIEDIHGRGTSTVVLRCTGADLDLGDRGTVRNTS